MLFWFFVFLLAIVFLPLVFLLIRWKLSYRVLNSIGIKGPAPELYYGNSNEIKALTQIKFIEINLKKYGNTFGYYTGIVPNIVVTDLEMLRQIMIKQFDTFTDRQVTPDLLRKKTESKARGLFSSQGEDWRRMRRILSKSFNAINLSKMSPLIDSSCESLVTKMSEYVDKKESFDVWKLYGLFTMETILATAFGHRVDVINGEDDELAEASSSIFAYGRTNSGFSITTILSNFPFLEGYIRSQALKSKAAKNYLYVEALTEKLVKKRLEEDHSANSQDLLQLLIDARADPDDDEEGGYKIMDPSKRKLADVEIVRTALSFMLAGHETTNNTIAYVSYLLALHPEEQEKLYKEITDYYSTKPNATLFEAAQSLVYLDMIIQESLRVYPPAPITNRHTSKDITINGQMFPKGSTVIIPIISLHHSPDIWPEPAAFKPERFTREEKEKRHQMAHMPFGWGPRSCIGMRLALIEAKMALIAMMKEYRFVEAPDTEKPLKTSVGITMIPTNGIYLRVETR